MKGTFGEATIAVPRDRKGEYETILIAKVQTRFNGVDDKILALYVRGMMVQDIQEALQELKELLGMWMTENESSKF
ncbi:MAG: transposase [Pseudanabaena sp. CoA8_M7]|nr:transposase [Pseudanabaena sp. CoA8_M7]